MLKVHTSWEPYLDQLRAMLARGKSLRKMAAEFGVEVHCIKNAIRNYDLRAPIPQRSDPIVQTIAQYLEQGWSFAKIAARLNLTRDQVAGYAYRHNLTSKMRRKNASPPPTDFQKRQIAQLWEQGATRKKIYDLAITTPYFVDKVLNALPPPPPAPAAAPPVVKYTPRPRLVFTTPLPPPPEKIRRLLALNACACRWPIGDPYDPGFYFCAEPGEPGLPYCPDHAARAYVALPQKTREAA